MTNNIRRITHYAGDTLVFEVTTKADNGSIVDLTNSELEWGLARSPNDTPEVVKTTSGGGITLTDPENGKFGIEVLPEDTELISGTYYHEVELTDSSGNVSTLLSGDIEIKQSLV